MDCRLLPHEIRDGPANMALDHALLDAVDSDPAAAYLRTYGWSEPTLSLGYFQSLAEAEPRWRGHPVVRRPSGGGALWHDRELTYALVVPRTHPLAGRPSDLYRAVHAALADALRSRGIDAARRGESRGDGADRPFLCFLDRDPEDILLDGVKIVGSAQRRRPRAVLQHGALLLGRSPTTPELPGLTDLAGPAIQPADWSPTVRDAIATALELVLTPAELPSSITAAAEELQRSVYRNQGWTGRR